jgi:microcystin degradation protein MlrC
VTVSLAVARLWFEGNAFSPSPTGIGAFREREWSKGKDALEAARGTNTELAAVAELPKDWSVTVLRCAAAMPGGPIEDGLFSSYLDELRADLAKRRWDAVYLSLHGAAITQSGGSPELRILRAVRDVVGDVPVVASFDLHANLNPALAGMLDFASGYRTYPHVDMKETADRVLNRLKRIISGEKAKGVIHNTGIPLGSFNMWTGADPMRSLLIAARALERPPIADVTLFGGFPYADSPDCGASVMAWADERHAAELAARILADSLRKRAPEFDSNLPSPLEGLKAALAAPPGLACVLDPADNPYSGGAADTPGLLRALLDLAPSVPAVFSFFADPSVVATAWQAGQGKIIDVELGGKRTALFGTAIPVQATVLRLTEGEYTNMGPMERGMRVSLGRTAVLEVQAIRVIVTERVAPPNDPAFYALHGIDLERTRLLCVKSKNHFRAAFQERCAAIIQVDCPGPAAANLKLLPFKNLRLA